MGILTCQDLASPVNYYGGLHIDIICSKKLLQQSAWIEISVSRLSYATSHMRTICDNEGNGILMKYEGAQGSPFLTTVDSWLFILSIDGKYQTMNALK